VVTDTKVPNKLLTSQTSLGSDHLDAATPEADRHQGAERPRFRVKSKSSENLTCGLYDDSFPAVLVVGVDGLPFEGETQVQFVETEGAFHLFADTSARLIVYFTIIDFNCVLPAYFPVRCLCLHPSLNSSCRNWRPKGRRSALVTAASVSLGRLPRHGDRLTPDRLFAQRIFLAEIATVRTGRGTDQRTRKPVLLPRAAWHSRVGRIIGLVAGSTRSS
jgi:hypothetical protein